MLLQQHRWLVHSKGEEKPLGQARPDPQGRVVLPHNDSPALPAALPVLGLELTGAKALPSTAVEEAAAACSSPSLSLEHNSWEKNTKTVFFTSAV